MNPEKKYECPDLSCPQTNAALRTLIQYIDELELSGQMSHRFAFAMRHRLFEFNEMLRCAGNHLEAPCSAALFVSIAKHAGSLASGGHMSDETHATLFPLVNELTKHLERAEVRYFDASEAHAKATVEAELRRITKH